MKYFHSLMGLKITDFSSVENRPKMWRLVLISQSYKYVNIKNSISNFYKSKKKSNRPILKTVYHLCLQLAISVLRKLVFTSVNITEKHHSTQLKIHTDHNEFACPVKTRLNTRGCKWLILSSLSSFPKSLRRQKAFKAVLWHHKTALIMCPRDKLISLITSAEPDRDTEEIKGLFERLPWQRNTWKRRKRSPEQMPVCILGLCVVARWRSGRHVICALPRWSCVQIALTHRWITGLFILGINRYHQSTGTIQYSLQFQQKRNTSTRPHHPLF